jgi:hypothetical protein
MATLKSRETKKITLKNIKDAELEIYTSYTAGDVSKMQSKLADPFLTPLVLIIKSWNLTNDKGEKLKINEEHVSQLDIVDVLHIVDEAGIETNTFLAERKTQAG